jgi:hypothetical protein
VRRSLTGRGRGRRCRPEGVPIGCYASAVRGLHVYLRVPLDTRSVPQRRGHPSRVRTLPSAAPPPSRVRPPPHTHTQTHTHFSLHPRQRWEVPRSRMQREPLPSASLALHPCCTWRCWGLCSPHSREPGLCLCTQVHLRFVHAGVHGGLERGCAPHEQAQPQPGEVHAGGVRGVRAHAAGALPARGAPAPSLCAHCHTRTQERGD